MNILFYAMSHQDLIDDIGLNGNKNFQEWINQQVDNDGNLDLLARDFKFMYLSSFLPEPGITDLEDKTNDIWSMWIQCSNLCKIETDFLQDFICLPDTPELVTNGLKLFDKFNDIKSFQLGANMYTRLYNSRNLPIK